MATKGGGPRPQAPAQTAVNIEEDIFDDEDDEYLEDDEPEVLTGVGRKKKRIVLTKQTYLLVIFVIVAGLGVAGLVLAYRQVDDWGGEYPPTVKSQAAFVNTVLAIFVLTIITPIGFVILKFRITNLLVGFLYMFILVVIIFFSMKGISSGYYSYQEDTDLTIHQFYASTFDPSVLNDFWDYYQFQQQCCGTKHIDIVDDWSGFLKTSRIPDSCCTPEWVEELVNKYPTVSRENLVQNCAKGLGRVREIDLRDPKLKQPKRMYSGFFLSLTEKEVEKVSKNFGLLRPEGYSVMMMDVRVPEIKTVAATEAFNLNWKTFYVDSIYNQLGLAVYNSLTFTGFSDAKKLEEIDLLYSKLFKGETKLEGWDSSVGRVANDILDPADVDHKKISDFVVGLSGTNNAFLQDLCFKIAKQNRLEYPRPFNAKVYCTKRIFKKRLSANTLGRELLLRLDYLTSYIHLIADDADDDEKTKLKRRAWMLWEMPTEYNGSDIYAHKLAANLFRKDPKKMYYMSRGIAENYVLNGIVHNRTCELVDTRSERLANLKKKLARDLNKRWRQYGIVAKWKNPDQGLGLFYLTAVHEVALYSIIIGGSCIGCVVVIAIIFWQYYSRIKAEEYANLALPKEFEVLNLRRGSMIDASDIQRKKKKRGNKVTPGGLRRGFGRGGFRRPGQPLPFLQPRSGLSRFGAPPRHHLQAGHGAPRHSAPGVGPRPVPPQGVGPRPPNVR